MKDPSKACFELLLEQQAVQDRCFHPSRRFEPFSADDAEGSIQSCFEKTAHKHPNRIAIKTGNNTITYSALNTAANRLANTILALRGEAQEVVAFSHPHGILPLISHLAILKAGRISVELDPAASRERNTHILLDSTATVLLTDNRTRQMLDGWIDSPAIALNVDELDFNVDDRNPNVASTSNDIAYLRYTSGSTGQAKGAIKTQRHVLHEVRDLTNCFRLCMEDHVSHLSRESMGKFVFSALLNGATLYPLDTKQKSLPELAAWLDREQITSYQSFPTAFRYLVNSLNGGERFPSLRLIRLEGEVLYRQDVELYKKYFPSHCLLVNVYSSAETGTVSMYFMAHNTAITGGSVPMGYPIEGKQVLLLDKYGNEVGVNQVGEIAVKSRRLSAGYWRREDLTEKKFVKTSNRPERDLYLTGDLGSLSERGLLRYLGRKDFQIKIHGFRVDAGEIEAALVGHADVKEAVVVSLQDQSGNNELAGYVVPRNGNTVDSSVLRKFLAQSLPDYMVPRYIISLDHIPLTATGKVDRKALPTPDKDRPELGQSYTAPRTQLEQSLANIWAEVLKLDKVGVHDNFFELGGHSLLATQFISRSRNVIHLELPLRTIFEHPTIAGLAVEIERARVNTAAREDATVLLTELESLRTEK
jgi:amino acid adenylation domain-containing protein